MKNYSKRAVIVLFFIWILHEQFVCKKIFAQKEKSESFFSARQGLQEGLIRATFILKQEYLEKIKAYAYWERLQIKDVLDDMCEHFFKDKIIEPIPERRK